MTSYSSWMGTSKHSEYELVWNHTPKRTQHCLLLYMIYSMTLTITNNKHKTEHTLKRFCW